MDTNLSKCKTKCIAFLQKARPLPAMYLCRNQLPWVSKGKHLGITIPNKIDGMKANILMKRADYIKKNHEFYQEFLSAIQEPKSKLIQFTTRI